MQVQQAGVDVFGRDLGDQLFEDGEAGCRQCHLKLIPQLNQKLHRHRHKRILLQILVHKLYTAQCLRNHIHQTILIHELQSPLHQNRIVKVEHFDDLETLLVVFGVEVKKQGVDEEDEL